MQFFEDAADAEDGGGVMSTPVSGLQEARVQPYLSMGLENGYLEGEEVSVGRRQNSSSPHAQFFHQAEARRSRTALKRPNSTLLRSKSILLSSSISSRGELCSSCLDLRS